MNCAKTSDDLDRKASSVCDQQVPSFSANKAILSRDTRLSQLPPYLTLLATPPQAFDSFVDPLSATCQVCSATYRVAVLLRDHLIIIRV